VTHPEPYPSWHPEPTHHLPVPASLPPYPVPVVVPQKSVGAAVVLELVPGLFGVFGIGNLYAGRIVTGLLLMFSFWALFWVNFLLIFVFIGIVTMPLTWIGYLVVGALTAARGAERHNSRAIHGMIA
jgi:TM2 domain-containing membrane protein YozV